MASIKKPVLVIKKNHLYKPNALILQKAIKRPLPFVDNGNQDEDISVKKPCPMNDMEISQNPKPTLESEAQKTSSETNVKNISKSVKDTRSYRRLKPKIQRNTNFCQSHGAMIEHQAKGLVCAGDIFSSAEEFTNYVNRHAKEWLFYYVTTSSRNNNLYKHYDESKPSYYDYKCRYFKGEHKSTSKGLRKVKVETVACPANIRMRRGGGEHHFEVIRACHHHNHELSFELFNQMPHGYRLPQEVKDEIRDLTRFGLDPMLLRRYLQYKLGVTMNKTVYNFMAKVKKDTDKPHYPPDKVKDILSNIKFIKTNFNIPFKVANKVVIKKETETINETTDIDDKEGQLIFSEVVKKNRDLPGADIDSKTQINPWEATVVNKVEIDNCNVNDEYGISPGVYTNYDNVTETCVNQDISTVENENYYYTEISDDVSTIENINHDYETEVCVSGDISTVEDTNHEYDTKLSVSEDTNNDFGNDVCVKEDISSMEDTNHEYDNEVYVEEHISTVEYINHENHNDPELCAANDILTVEYTNHENYSHTEISIIDQSSTADDSIHEYGNDTEICVTSDIPTAEDTKIEHDNDADTTIVDRSQEIVGNTDCVTDSNEQFVIVNKINNIKPTSSSNIEPPKRTKKLVMREFIKIIPISQIGKVSSSGDTKYNLQTRTVIRPGNSGTVVQTFDQMSKKTSDQSQNVSFIKSDPICTSNIYGRSVTKSNIQTDVDNPTNTSIKYESNTNKSNQSTENQRILNTETGAVKVEPVRDSNDLMNRAPAYKKERSFIKKSNEPYRKDKTDPPEVRCQRRHKDLPEYKADGLVKIGDVFESIEAFYSYANERAKHWFFYYLVCDSRNNRKSEHHNVERASWVYFCCRFNKGKRIRQENKGIRKRKPKNIICPAGVQMRSDPGTSSFYVTYVCNHHSHELSLDLFKQESHFYRLPHELKNEIYQLLWLKLDREYVHRYVSSITGYNLRKTIWNIHHRMQRTNMKLNMTQDKVKEVSAKIKEIKKLFPSCRPTKASSIRKHVQPKHKEETKSRLEARLNNILYDQELIHSVQELERSTGCEIHIHTWGEDNAHVKHETSNPEQGVMEYDNTVQEDNENQIEVDSELYSMNENVEYIIPHGSESDMCSADNTEEKADENYNNAAVKTEQISTDPQGECSYEYIDNEYQIMYQYPQGEESLGDNGKSQEPREIDNYSKDSTSCGDVGVQADLEIIELERDCEILNRLESETLRQDMDKSTLSFSTRGNPKEVLEEAIINRFNFEFYIGLCGITTCLDNLANSMKLSVLDLLKKIYQGEAVFKMSVGRSGKKDRKTVQLKYVPLTITFPFEKFKYINGLQEYKAMCSKYSDMALKLESVVDDLSTNLKVTEAKVTNLELHNKELIQLNADTEDLKRSLDSSNESLKTTRARLLEAEAMNEKLVKKNTKLEIELEALKDSFMSLERSQAELHRAQAQKERQLKTNAEQRINRVRSTLARQNEFLQIRIKDIENNLAPRSSILFDRLKTLKEARDKLNEENESQKKHITNLEDLYFADYEILLDKIKVLEEELSVASTNTSVHNCGKSETCQISLEIENKMLHKKIKNLTEINATEKHFLLGKQQILNNRIKKLEEVRDSENGKK